MDGDITKRMADVSIGKPFVIGCGDEGKPLPVYSIACTTERTYQAGCGIGKYSFGETGVNRAAEESNGRGLVHRASEESVV